MGLVFAILQLLVVWGLVIALLAIAYRRFHASRKKAEYVRHEEGSALRFDVTPAGSPVLWSMVILAAVMAIGASGMESGAGLIACLMFTGLGLLLLLRDFRGKPVPRPTSFRLVPGGIEIGHQLLRRDAIHYLRIKNPFAGNFEIVYDANRGLSTGTLAGLAHRRRLAEVAYRVEVESGGKAHVLAAGLDEVTARGIAAEVGQALKIGE